MLSKIKQFVKTYQTDIILLIGVILISLLSFAMGYIVVKEQEKEPLKIEQRDTNTPMTHQCYEYNISIIGVNS